MCDEICVMCNKADDNLYELGEKITSQGVTVHYFCVLLSSKLPQNGKDEDGIYGFLPADILKEKKRASKKKCIYCHKNGANISCCAKRCSKSFHLPCAIKQDCRFEFFDEYKSFCNKHHGLKKETIRHNETDLCAICHDKMGEFNKIRSIRSPCCKAGWYHKMCLSQYAATASLFMKCTICNRKIDEFRRAIEKRGVFIPITDAMWEKPQQSSFYEFEQHLRRPSECVAKRCQMSNGYDETNEYLLILCTYCGSKGVHECCLNGTDEFICSDCGPPPAKKRRLMDETIAVETVKSNPQPELPSLKRRKITKCIDETDMNNNVQRKSPTETSTSKPKFVLREISIRLVRLENIFKKIE